MEAKELLDLAKQFIKTEAGKKALGIGLDINNLKKQADDVKEQLNPEDIEARLKEYIPVLEEYTIRGRLFDKTTSTPLARAKVMPVLAIGKQVQTNDQGEFSIKLKLPILPFNQKALVETQLLATKDNYIPTNLNVLTGERMVKTDIKTKGIVNIQKAAELAASEIRQEINEKIEDAKNIAYSIPEKVMVVRREQISKLQNTILFKLVPLSIGLLLIFGITNFKDLKNSRCPKPSQLKQAARKRNRIVRQLNQIYRMVAINVALAALFSYIAGQLRGVDLSLSSIPTTPPAPIPLLKIQRIREIIQDIIENNKSMNINLLVALVFFVAALILLMLILKAVDSLIFKCSKDTDIELEEINSELRDLTKEAEQKDAVSATNKINGFTIEVVNVDQNAVGKYKRRQAVAKNSQGVVMVKGDPSFSAEDTVLINELAYYIQSEDLKAF